METIILVAQFLVVIVVWLMFKYAIPSYIKKKFENLADKEDIEDLTEKIEAVKSNFEKEKIIFSLYHQKQAEVIGEIYSRLNESLDNVRLLVIDIDFKTQKSISVREKKSRALNSVLAFRTYYWKNIIYLSKEL